MPACANRAVISRKDSDVVRLVVCDRAAATWAPISSGGISCAVHRWMCCRSTGSLQSEAHTRSVCWRTPRSTRPPPLAHDSISSGGWRDCLHGREDELPGHARRSRLQETLNPINIPVSTKYSARSVHRPLVAILVMKV
jgi:hypothetical protein